MVAAAVRTIFAQPDAVHVHEQLGAIAAMLGRQFPAVEATLRDAEPEAHDEWQVSDRRYLSEGSMAALAAADSTEEVLAQPALIPA